MKKFAVVLSGSGVYDGAEIHEATMTLYAIAKYGAEYEIFAPDIEQHHVINHITGKEMMETRNVLVESARIARGHIKPLAHFNASEFDAIVFPGGFGVAKNLSDFAFNGPDCEVIPQVNFAVSSMIEQGKPIGALCISPAIIARIVKGAKVTIGQDVATIEGIEAMGGNHQLSNHGEVVFDEKHKIFSTPCYMLDAKITDIADGAENIIKEMLKIM